MLFKKIFIGNLILIHLKYIIILIIIIIIPNEIFTECMLFIIYNFFKIVLTIIKREKYVFRKNI